MLPPRAYLFLGLNAVRILSIISLLLVFSSNIFVLVTDVEAYNQFQAIKQSGNATSDFMLNCDYIQGSTVPNQPAGIFWAVVGRLIIIFEAVVLILAEIGWPDVFFQRFFPVLGSHFGLGALGLFECLISASILSQHVGDFALVSSFFLFTLGCINLLCGLIFREKAKVKRSITSWREEAKGVLPTSKDGRPVFTGAKPAFVAAHFTKEKSVDEGSDYGTWKSSNSSSNGYGFGKHAEKAAGLKGFLISKPVESLPRYAARPTSRPPSPGDTPTFKSSMTAI